ncbi:MAG: chloride channel protein [Verrucomicrobiales bacterium]|nr:chloride channel protein [Verrucomicrobiales bacterium]MCP5525675.1 chloride channel protein [Verrucomicrobiales bacterium]
MRSIHGLLTGFLNRLPARTRSILATCVYGLLAGLAAVAFQLAVHATHRNTIARAAALSKTEFALWSLGILVAASLIVGWLLNAYCKEAAGSGIPQLKLAFWKDFGYVPWRTVWVKFVAGVVSVGGGCSLGREGPSVQIAGGLASNLAGTLGEPKQNRRPAAAAGAAAGLAAAFNTPLAAITFVLEEIIADLNSRFLGSVLLASVLGAFVVHGLIGAQPAFILRGAAAPHWQAYLLTPMVAAAAALVGVAFQKWTLGLRSANRRLTAVPVWIRPVFGGLITWAIGCAVFWHTGRLGVFGLGYDDLSAALDHKIVWQIALILLGAKLLATVACYGFGGSGGIFSPTLFLGGMAGVGIAELAATVLPLSPGDRLALAVVGMSACLNAVVRAPVTGILIVFEMTHEFALVPALMMGALVSGAIARRLCRENFYEALLQQDGHHLDRVIPPRDLQSWQQLPVSAIANFQPVVVADLRPEALEALLKEHPYQRWPVVGKTGALSLLTRAEAEEALSQKREPRLEPAVTCRPGQTIQDLQMSLIQSTANIVVLTDPKDGRVLGLVTLHDVLRAQSTMSRRRGED